MEIVPALLRLVLSLGLSVGLVPVPPLSPSKVLFKSVDELIFYLELAHEIDNLRFNNFSILKVIRSEADVVAWVGFTALQGLTNPPRLLPPLVGL